MGKKKGIVLLVLILAALSLATNTLGAQCACKVTNQGKIVTSSKTCNQAGHGAVSCFQMALGSVAGEPQPKSGECEDIEDSQYVCGPAEPCRFAKIQFVVTAAPCFASCDYNGQPPIFDPVAFQQGAPVALVAGATAKYTVKRGNNTACGTPKQDVTISFFNANRQVVYELRARYHCSECDHLAGN